MMQTLEPYEAFKQRMISEGWQPKTFPIGGVRSFARNLHRWYRPQEAFIELSPDFHPEHRNEQWWRYKPTKDVDEDEQVKAR